MKTFFISFFLTLTTIVVNSQQIQQISIEDFYTGENAHLNHAYYKDFNNLLNKYVGTWEYNQNGHYFKITFFKQTNFRETPVGHPKVSIFSDRIYGHYQYKLNGVEIYNTSSQNFAYSLSGAFTHIGFFIFYDEPSISPCGRPLMGEVTLIYSVVSGIEKLTWNRTDSFSGTFCQQGQIEDNTPFKTPANMVLTKVN